MLNEPLRYLAERLELLQLSVRPEAGLDAALTMQGEEATMFETDSRSPDSWAVTVLAEPDSWAAELRPSPVVRESLERLVRAAPAAMIGRALLGPFVLLSEVVRHGANIPLFGLVVNLSGMLGVVFLSRVLDRTTPTTED